MTHSTQDLLLAAEIRNLAMPTVIKRLKELPESEREDSQQAVMRQELRSALNELKFCADIISDYRSLTE